MAGYVSSFATGAAIEAALNKANNSQSALNATQLEAVNSGITDVLVEKIITHIDTLWSDSNGATVRTEYTMAGNINDYDMVYVKISTVPDVNDLGVYTQNSFLPSLIGTTGKISFQGLYSTRVVVVDFSPGTSFTVISNNAETSNQKPTIYGIVGIKY